MRIRIPAGSPVQYLWPVRDGDPVHLDAFSSSRVNHNIQTIISLLEDEEQQTYISSDVLPSLTCPLCSEVYQDPVTTPCQHSFCASCLRAALNRNNFCPLGCTEPINQPGGYDFWENKPMDRLMHSLISVFFPSRAAPAPAPPPDTRTPIFLVSLIFPGQNAAFQIFEPRYRLMLRRCLELEHPSASPNGFPTLGIMMPSTEYGCIVEVHYVQMVRDGRSLVKVRGTHPFRVRKREVRDEYLVAHTEIIRDIPDPAYARRGRLGPRTPDPHTLQRERREIHDLVEICLAFLRSLREHIGNNILERISQSFGPPPLNDPAMLSYWFARILPGDDEAGQAELLGDSCPRKRLERVVHWIAQAGHG